MAANPPSAPPADRRPANQRASAEQAMLMREVDEAVRQDQVSTVAQKYGIVIISAVVLVLALFGGWLLWQNRLETQLEEQSEQLVIAIDQLEAGNLDAADSQLETLTDGTSPAGFAAAQLLRAGIALQQGRDAEALELFNAVAEDRRAPDAYRDLANVRAVMMAFDSLPPQQVVDRLGPIAVPENAWFGSAGELLALAYLADGREEEAGPLLVSIARNEAVPLTLRARTRQLAGLLGYDAVEDVDATLAELAQADAAQPIAAPIPAAPQ